MKIEYAKPLTELERSAFFSMLKSKHNQISSSSEFILNSMSEKLLSKYHEFKKIIEDEFDIIKTEYEIDFKAFKSETCVCGSDLHFIKSHGFYGCGNYNLPGKHKNFKNSDGFSNEPYVRMPEKAKSYLTDIIVSLGLRDKLNAKNLHIFYTINLLEDLKLKYTGVPYDKLINQYSSVKKVATEFENKCYTRCLPLYTKVLKQLGIKYKVHGDKEKYCFIDLLCSNENVVHIYECKTSKSDIDVNQNELYLSLISFMDNSGRDIELINLTDTDNTGFETIEQRELWLNNGKFFGYPSCCIDSFMNKNHTNITINMNTGFTPCAECCKKINRPRDLEKLIRNRSCEFEFPFCDDWYKKIYPEYRPDYFINEPHEHI